MLRLLLVIFIALQAANAAAEARDFAVGDNPLWRESERAVTSVASGLSFPRSPGTLQLTGSRDFVHETAGIDSTIQYKSADGAIFASVYVYLPGLAHPGLASLATQAGMEASSTSPPKLTRRGTVAAGGLNGMAIRDDYVNYRGTNVSSAAFVKAGQWQVKFRVTGPQERKGEVDAAMDALLAGMRFARNSPAGDPLPIGLSACANEDRVQADARLLPDAGRDDLLKQASVLMLDGAGPVGRDREEKREALPSRIPQVLCMSRLAVNDVEVPLLRAPDGPARSVDGRTRLVALLTDAGSWLELVHVPNLDRYLLLHHDVGSRSLLGAYDGILSDRQIAALLNGEDREGTKIRVPVTLKPDGNSVLTLPSEESGRPGQGT